MAMEGDSISNIWVQMDDNPVEPQVNEDADATRGRAVALHKKTSKFVIARRAITALRKRIHIVPALRLRCAGANSFKGHDSDHDIPSQGSTSELSDTVSDAKSTLSRSLPPRQSQKVDLTYPVIGLHREEGTAPKYTSAMVESDKKSNDPLDSEKDSQPVVDGDAHAVKSAVDGSQDYKDYKEKARLSYGSSSISKRIWSTAKDDLRHRDLNRAVSSSLERFVNSTTTRGKSPELPSPPEERRMGSVIDHRYLTFGSRSRRRNDPFRSYLPSIASLQTTSNSGPRYQLLDPENEMAGKSSPALISAPSSSPVREEGNTSDINSNQSESDDVENLSQLQDFGAESRSKVVSRRSDANLSVQRSMTLLQQLQRGYAAHAQVEEDPIETPLLDRSDHLFNHLVDMAGHISGQAEASSRRLAMTSTAPYPKPINTNWTMGRWDMTDTPMWVRADPPKYLHLHPTGENQFECTIKLENISQRFVGYKFKGNHPQGYILDPKLGVLAPGAKTEVKAFKLEEPTAGTVVGGPNRKRNSKDLFVLITLPLDVPSGQTIETAGLDPFIFEKRKVECRCEVVLQAVKCTYEIDSYQCKQLKGNNRGKIGTTFDNILTKMGFSLSSIPEEPSQDD